jgi:hypothetical protein
MLTKIFCEIDDFMQEFEESYKKRLLESQEVKVKYGSRLSMSEVMTIVVYYHNYGNRTFKDFYLKSVSKHLKEYFPNLVSYNRFVELIPMVLIPLIAFLKLKRLVVSNEITFIDSTKIAICNNKRIKRNRVFEGIAKRGKSTMGWFYGFKLHIAINEKGELCGANMSKGNIDDRDKEVLDEVLKNVSGKLFEHLFEQGTTLITNVRKNMKCLVDAEGCQNLKSSPTQTYKYSYPF